MIRPLLSVIVLWLVIDRAEPSILNQSTPSVSLTVQSCVFETEVNSFPPQYFLFYISREAEEFLPQFENSEARPEVDLTPREDWQS